MISLDRRVVFARHTRWLAITLEALVLLSLLAGAIPLALAQPVWWLRLSDAALNLAPVLLLAVLGLQLGVVLLESDGGLLERDSDDALISGRRSHLISGRHSHQLTFRWAWIFALLVPLQLAGFAWLMLDSDNQLNAQILQVDRQASAYRSLLLASRSESDLRSLVAERSPALLAALKPGPLPQQKQQISEAVRQDSRRFHSTLTERRNSLLASSLPGSLRVLIGAVIVSTLLISLRRWI